MNKTVRVAILEDHFLVSMSIQEILKLQNDVAIIHVNDLANDFLKQIKRSNVDVVFLDLQLPDKHGLDVVDFLREHHPSIKIIILSCVDDVQVVQHLLEKGCNAYITKGGADSDTILQAFKCVVENETYLSPNLKKQMKKEPLVQINSIINGGIRFTKREIEVLVLMNSGLNSKETSEKLFISRRTVETHRQNLMSKLEVNNSVALLHKATLLGLV